MPWWQRDKKPSDSATVAAVPRQAEDTRDNAFSSDRPESSIADDRLGRGTFAARLAATLVERSGRDGLVIGLYGPWGDGKTTLLQMIEWEIKRTSQVEVVWFNPWYFRQQDDLILGFLNGLALALELRLGKAADELKRVLNKYGTLLSFLPTSVMGMDFGKPMTEAASRIQGSTLEALKRQLEEGLAKANIDLVVFIDDIDRLARDEIHYVLRLVKLVADFRRVTYVLAFDDEMVAAAVASQYGSDPDAGKKFLEKIVQVPLRLPRPEQTAILHLTLAEVDRALSACHSDLPQQEVLEFRRYFDPLFASERRTLREAKRFGNALAFALPLLKHEVRIGDLLLLEGLRALAPGVYAALTSSRDLLLRPSNGAAEKAARATQWQDLLGKATPIQRDAVADLLKHLYPRVRSAIDNYHFGGDWDVSWAAERRAASSDYFDRYFLYAVPKGDVSDAAMEHFVGLLERGETAAATIALHALINESNAERVIRKLRLREDKISASAARVLIAVLVTHGHTLPDPKTFFTHLTARSQAMILVDQLMIRQANSAQGDLLNAIVKEAPDLGLAAQVFRKGQPS